MDCAFCTTPVEFSQAKMAHRIFELDDPGNKWWLCRDCAEIRSEGAKTKGTVGQPGDCIDCDDPAEYGIAIVKKTPRGGVETDGTVFQTLCEEHFEERQA
ncbi:hypothetical protein CHINAEXTREME_15635 [Halobiforma lacisalsi AJ5]|uniref:Uncharacterized protein n=1 Tax=Natronobacterium lacisalsi AJ5 TaxID=358396 RepID=M0LFN0_NATLA|nr:hypothetical protein [Halobiforma lacisalsi]APW99118.1 hypothetical protein CHINAEXTREME_15635 [Halobiforma lacisalsi AJ5]EMA31239.1 hypothetical protein C445_15069 [Halobiforma lacisalsi AJ5]